MGKFDEIFNELNNLSEGDVLHVEGTNERYYNSEKVKNILTKNLPYVKTEVELPEGISNLFFTAERKGWTLLKVIRLLQDEGHETERGYWFTDPDNQEKLVLGWFFGYTVYNSEEIPAPVVSDLEELKRDGSELFETIRYGDSFSSEIMHWVVHGGLREDTDKRLIKVVEHWED